jgi:hypothetical protein
MDRSSEDTFSAERRIVTLIHSAIAGASIAATLELASRENLDVLLLVSLACFAVALPAAIALVVLSQVIYAVGKQPESGNVRSSKSWPVLTSVLAVADQLACFGGFLALFWHFHWIVGAIFLFAAALAYLTLWVAERRMREKSVLQTV